MREPFAQAASEPSFNTASSYQKTRCTVLDLICDVQTFETKSASICNIIRR